MLAQRPHGWIKTAAIMAFVIAIFQQRQWRLGSAANVIGFGNGDGQHLWTVRFAHGVVRSDHSWRGGWAPILVLYQLITLFVAIRGTRISCAASVGCHLSSR